MMKEGFVKGILGILLLFFVLKSCVNCTSGGNRYSNTQPAVSEVSELTKLVRKYKDEKNFSIILYDMDSKNSESSNATYLQQYQVVVEKPDTVTAEVTEWYKVSPQMFNKHINDLGMEIISKKDGVLHQEAAPAGYTNYVGNPQYGHWVNRSGGSFWEFYGKYAFMSSMFNMMTYPARRAYWNDYHTNYYGRGSYYGPRGRTVYGTSTYKSTSTTGTSKRWSSKPSTFKSKVRNQVARSAAASKSKSYSSGSRYGSNKTTRSSSRSSSGSSYRSRSGGFGK
ncbi:hypothetical protein NBRC110019_21250 [Neptunitalea chrysea]|uniref:Uncharacterized protein n=1 Tax=Neptunitalea chrysea TaxID=1647581 RepID=A0A9W6B7M9_9FLAO|nr:hypothetical protein [Neptunitalea chrysea]GLB53085.1 hypothetical protein NBRC110019_21250 [Neptunitalea chrysea]